MSFTLASAIVAIFFRSEQAIHVLRGNVSLDSPRKKSQAQVMSSLEKDQQTDGPSVARKFGDWETSLKETGCLKGFCIECLTLLWHRDNGGHTTTVFPTFYVAGRANLMWLHMTNQMADLLTWFPRKTSKYVFFWPNSRVISYNCPNSHVFQLPHLTLQGFKKFYRSLWYCKVLVTLVSVT